MKLTPDQFFGKYDQKGIDFDGYYGFQCVDLYRQYVKECLDLPQSPGVTGAKDIWTTYLKKYFDRIDNTLTAIPIKGDIIIWGEGAGAWGHVAICKDGEQLKFTSFDQNWPVNSVCHFQPHNYNNVLGWLRVKPPVEPTPVPEPTPTPEPIPEPPVVVPTPPVVPEPPVIVPHACISEKLVNDVKEIINSRWTWIGRTNGWKKRLSELKQLLG